MQATLTREIFEKKFFSHIPSDIRQSFSPEQIQALEDAFGEQWARHPLDIRRSFGFWRFRYYFVIIGGRERRDLTRRQERFFSLSELAFYIGFLAFSTSLGILALYLVKSALGIDIFPHFSFGIWDWWRATIMKQG